MRICIVSRTDLYPAVHGGAVKIVRTAESLSRLVDEVVVVTGDRLQYHRYVDGRHEMVPYPQWLIGATRVPARALPALARLKVPDYWKTVEYVLDVVGYPRDEHLLYQPVFDPDFWVRTLYVGRRHKIDVYQAEFPGFAMPCLIAARLNGGKTSIVQHNVEWLRLQEMTALDDEVIGRLREIEVALLDWVDEIIAVSEDDRQRMLADGLEAEKITVIPHGVGVRSYRGKAGAGIRERYGIPHGVPLLFFHGTLHYYPNTVACRLLVEHVLPELQRRGIEVRALVCGMSPPEYLSHPWLTYGGVADDLPSHIAAADVCVVPLQDGGGTRMKILEYFAAARAVVSTRKGAEGLFVEDGRHLYLTDDDDMTTFCDRIQRLIGEPLRAEAMGEAAHAFVSLYDWDDVCVDYVRLYRGEIRGTNYNEDTARPALAASARPLEERIEELSTQEQKRRAKVERARLELLKQAYIDDAEELIARYGQELEGHEHGHGDGCDQCQPDDTQLTHEQLRGTAPASRYEVAKTAIADHIPVEVEAQKPRTMILLLNKRCNFRCDFCDLWHHKDMMSYEDAAKIIRRAPAAGVGSLVITGGEPFVHPRIFEIIELAKNLGLGVNITTNGSLVEGLIDEIVNSRVDSLSISIDGLEKTHDELRGRAGSFRSLWRAIDVVQARSEIHLNVYFVVTNKNVGELQAVYDMVAPRDINFDFWPVNGYPHLYVNTDESRATYRGAIDYIAAREPAVAARREYLEYGIQEYMGGARHHYRCLGLIEQFGVNHEGQVVPCCVWDQKELQVGSAIDTPLDQLLFSENAQKLREKIYHEGCVDQCFNHSLYEFQNATGLSFVVGDAQRDFDPDRAVVKESGRLRKERQREERRARRRAARAAKGGSA